MSEYGQYGQVSTDIQRMTKKIIFCVAGNGVEILPANPDRKFLSISSHLDVAVMSLNSVPYVGIYFGINAKDEIVDIEETPGGILIVPALVVNVAGTDYYSTFPPSDFTR
jgi:hypothetical protein